MPNGEQRVSEQEIFALLSEVFDPEIPVLNIVEMGIVRRAFFEGEQLVVDITPTYSGCPAMHEIESLIAARLRAGGFDHHRVRTTFAQPWTSDWMTDQAKEKLRAYGIAPPDRLVQISKGANTVRVCPYCGCRDTKLTSQFGSTSCKALYYCDGCAQPFEYFKAI